MTNTRQVWGTIKMLECSLCKATLPIAAFEGEADPDTIGLCSASQCDGLEVVVADANPAEWSDLAIGNVSDLLVRIGAEVGRDNLKIATVLRVESGDETVAGTSFAEFKKGYRPPAIVYSCPCCREGEATEVEEFTVEGFKQIGGSILPVDGLSFESER